MKTRSILKNGLIIIMIFVTHGALAKGKKMTGKPAQAKLQRKVVTPQASATVNRPKLLTSQIRKPSNLDPNSAVEVRGQARTLSMMLVLKSGKDSINFIKVRKDYHPEILETIY